MKYKTTEFEGKMHALVPLDDMLDLIQKAEWLQLMEAAGVDNWEGMSYANDLGEEDGYYKTWDESEDDEIEAKYFDRG